MFHVEHLMLYVVKLIILSYKKHRLIASHKTNI